MDALIRDRVEQSHADERNTPLPTVNFSPSISGDYFIGLSAPLPSLALQSHADKKNMVRPTADFAPSVWGDYFISCPAPPPSLIIQCPNPRINELKTKVKGMFSSAPNDFTKTLELIDELQHLGIAYHFEGEIAEALKRVKENEEEFDDLRTVALSFRLLREYGYDTSAGVFNKFKDSKGKFKEDLSNNVKDLLHLYDASYLRKREEDIFDEAIKFTQIHMEHLMQHVDVVLSAQIQRSLDIPFYLGMRRIDASHYIRNNIDKDEDNTNVTLELARLDFNHVQSLHLAEVKTISVWWRELGLAAELSFARDRVVECFFCSLGMHDEPQYSQGRMLMAKILNLTSVMDDMYDAYGTIEELQLFTNVIQRWNFQEVDQLPEYMRIYLNAYVCLIREIENELTKKGRLQYMRYFIESIKTLVGAFLKEAVWRNNKYMPTLEEYLQISIPSSASPMFACASLILTGEELSHELLSLVATEPKVIKASSLIVRVMDDLTSTEFEQQRDHVPSSVHCYMNNYGVQEEEARAQLNKMVANAWKEINEESLKNDHSQKHLNMLALNIARACKVVYNNGDGYTDPSGDMKENLTLLLLRPIGKVK